VAASQSESGAFEALGDAHRREILRLLGEGEKSVQEVASSLPISRPAVSRHLKLLTQAGLVYSNRHGTRQVYQLQAEGVEAVRKYLESVWGSAAGRFTIFAENTETETGGAE
jgi:DNA-binding transcriptional ArsR family regulator